MKRKKKRRNELVLPLPVSIDSHSIDTDASKWPKQPIGRLRVKAVHFRLESHLGHGTSLCADLL